MNFGGFMAKITPAWKMRKLHLWWFHEVNGNAFRRIHAINEELFEKDARTYHCNMCGRVVFKGSIKYGIVMNCPNCGLETQVYIDNHETFVWKDILSIYLTYKCGCGCKFVTNIKIDKSNEKFYEIIEKPLDKPHRM